MKSSAKKRQNQQHNIQYDMNLRNCHSKNAVCVCQLCLGGGGDVFHIKCWDHHSYELECCLTLNPLKSTIAAPPCNARIANVYYSRPLFGIADSLSYYLTAQCLNTEGIMKVFLCHICVSKHSVSYQ